MAPAKAVVRPWTIETDPQVIADESFGIIRKKGEKHASYLAHGEAVWLTVWIDTRFCLPTTMLHRLEEMNVQHGPFEKVIVGCSTRALVYDTNVVTYHQDF